MLALNSSDLQKPLLADQALEMQPPSSLLKVYPNQRLNAFPRIYFTEIDQAFLVWGVLTLVIFSFAQFSPMSWLTQSILDAALTGVGMAITSGLTWAIANQAKLLWVVLLWTGLMSAGTIVTVYGIFYSSPLILSNLCLLWLGLCVAGYGVMAIGMRSRSFTVACLVHLGALALPFYERIASLNHTFLNSTFLNYTLNWQFLSSGLVIALTLFFFSVFPWDRQVPDNDISC
ncbi:MAG: hypothetical protein AAF703_19705 [Cyanobacteria bacterium P01_D01_bin.105]